MSAVVRASALMCTLAIVAACTSTTPVRPTRTPTPTPSSSAAATDPGTPPTTGVPGSTGPETPEPTVPSTAEPTTGATVEPTTGPTVEPTPTPTLEPTPTPTEPPEPPPAVRVKVGVKKVLDGLDQPVGVFHARDDRLFILEQEGIIKLAKPIPGTDRYEVTGVFLDIDGRVACCGERGILGLAFHPRYADNGLFYVTYSDATHSFVLEEYRVSPDDPDTAVRRDSRKLIDIYKPYDYHWGGGIHFGRDGYLWLAMGDGGYEGGAAVGDPDQDAQQLGSLFGKLLRIDPLDPDGDGPQTYRVPPDNPYVDEPRAMPEIWARGLRNPWRWSFDPWTGDLWLTDTGHQRWEEVNRATWPDLGKGDNYGWRLMEGPACYIPSRGCDPNGRLVKPLAAYPHADQGGGPQCAITGGYVYRGQRYPRLSSRFFFGDYCAGRIWSVDAGGRDRQRARVMLDTDLVISSFGADAQGELYITSYEEGAIYRVTGEPPD